MKECSAGGAVYKKFRIQNSPASPRLGRGRAEFRIKWLICKHSGYHKWVLPKGIMEGAERPEEAAVREVEEETGITAKILKRIPSDVRYKYTKNGTLINKSVEFFLMKYVSGDIKDHCWEMEDVKWATVEKAIKLMAFETERKVLQQAVKLLK